MRIPSVRGLIDRRILVNFRVDPRTLSTVLPPPFRPQLVHGFGIAGICLIRLTQIRPRMLPSFIGVSSENAAHRIAVEWDLAGETRTGVFIPRRDTSSNLYAMVGGRLFPAFTIAQHFEVRETEREFHIDMHSLDHSAPVLVDGHIAAELPPDSIFPSVAEVSRFFEAGSLGYSPQTAAGRFDGLELKSSDWHVEPLSVTQVKSSFFDNRGVFPAGSVTFDNALLMRGIDHEWGPGRGAVSTLPSFAGE